MKNSKQENSIFPRGEKAPNQIFTGDVYVNMLVTDPEELLTRKHIMLSLSQVLVLFGIRIQVGKFC